MIPKFLKRQNFRGELHRRAHRQNILMDRVSGITVLKIFFVTTSITYNYDGPHAVSLSTSGHESKGEKREAES